MKSHEKSRFFDHFSPFGPYVSEYVILGIFDLRMWLYGYTMDKNKKYIGNVIRDINLPLRFNIVHQNLIVLSLWEESQKSWVLTTILLQKRQDDLKKSQHGFDYIMAKCDHVRGSAWAYNFLGDFLKKLSFSVFKCFPYIIKLSGESLWLALWTSNRIMCLDAYSSRYCLPKHALLMSLSPFGPPYKLCENIQNCYFWPKKLLLWRSKRP